MTSDCLAGRRVSKQVKCDLVCNTFSILVLSSVDGEAALLDTLPFAAEAADGGTGGAVGPSLPPSLTLRAVKLLMGSNTLSVHRELCGVMCVQDERERWGMCVCARTVHGSGSYLSKERACCAPRMPIIPPVSRGDVVAGAEDEEVAEVEDVASNFILQWHTGEFRSELQNPQ